MDSGGACVIEGCWTDGNCKYQDLKTQNPRKLCLRGFCGES